jgi:heat shock protein HslJ
MMGAWTDEDDQLAWDGEPAMTRKACPEELGAQDQWISDLLSDGMDISRGDADLTLESGDVTIEFDAEEESGADALLGRTWTVVGVIDDGRVSRLPDDATSPTLTVADDGTVAVDTGCNTGRTSVEMHESTVEFDTTAITLKACEPPADAVERTVLTVLDGTAQKVTDGSVLVLTRGDRGLVLDVQ